MFCLHQRMSAEHALVLSLGGDAVADDAGGGELVSEDQMGTAAKMCHAVALLPRGRGVEVGEREIHGDQLAAVGLDHQLRVGSV